MLFFIFHFFSHCTTKILCSSILNHLTGSHPVLSSCIDHVVLHLRIFLIINIMSSHLHNFSEFVCIEDFFLFPRIFPQEQIPFFCELFFLDPFNFSVTTHRAAIFNDPPSNDPAFREKPGSFFFCLFHYLICNFYIISICLYFFHLNRTGYKYCIFILKFQQFSRKYHPDRLFSGFLPQLIQICIHVIFYVYLWIVTYISYLSYIFRKLSFHDTFTSF